MIWISINVFVFSVNVVIKKQLSKPNSGTRHAEHYFSLLTDTSRTFIIWFIEKFYTRAGKRTRMRARERENERERRGGIKIIDILIDILIDNRYTE